MNGEPVESVIKNPLVCIVLATYNPNFTWFEEQLESLNNQTYENLKLLVLDDCSENESFEKITDYVERHITRFPYELYRNEENLGSNKTFEKLTAMAEGEYIAYCDQDDVWLPEKVETLVTFIENKNNETRNEEPEVNPKVRTALVCSDVLVIDETGKEIARSITEVRKRHVFKEGEGLASDLLFKNFVIGCTMLLPLAIAKQAMPFVTDMVHDHYLAMFAAMQGKICVYPENLIQYRIHGNNQTNVLAGVKTKQDYYEVRILPYLRRMEQINDRFPSIPKAAEALEWAEARDGWYRGEKGSLGQLWRYRDLDRKTTVFEVGTIRLPQFFFVKVLVVIQKGKI